MNKPTDEAFAELQRKAWSKGLSGGDNWGKEALLVYDRFIHDAGIAHGWQEAIEALRSVRPSADYWADYLDRIAKERGYV